ncbi:hypothetical protein [endosymbiont of unidentified scaly snail isolate Monju]|uniref:hypothetical protein n=1 Tax=endosymbiont of unidentified scaly snail isolate Monju TaxID=1248727 RepID=UPI0003891C5D|nr:hypothetical protein [endosymbiont of unidentified scaly snail isolate Monju]BAN68813.1 conserved hypothetical protein [endosymbiont of unidentified scaly snail isolate Monju]
MDNETLTRTDERTGTASTLGLVVPEQSPAPENSMLLEPRDTAEWIASLPLANIGETSRQVYTTLLDFNRYEIPDLVRAKVVELFRPTVDYVCHNLRRHYIDVGFPLSKKAWKTVVLARELNNELATSYKIIVERMLSGATERFDRKLLVIALHRTLHYLGRVYLQACLAYTRPPAQLWKQVNAVYAFSRQNHIHRIPVKMKMEDIEEVSTIEERYKALLLFAATVPSRLRQSHLEITFQKTLEWSGQTHFLGMDDDIPANGALNVSLTSDEGPIHNALRMPIASRHVAILDVRPLIQRLHAEYEEAPLDGSGDIRPGKPLISRALLRQLIRSWHAPAERQFVRTRLHFSLHVLTGFRSIHAALSPSPLPPSPSEELPSTFNSSPNINIPALTSAHQIDPLGAIDDSQLSLAPTSLDLQSGTSLVNENSSFLLNGNPLADKPGTPAEWQESRMIDPLDPKGMEVTTLNESAGGYCIQWLAKDHPPKVKVGQLLGVGSKDNPLDYSLAVIRWMHSISQERLELGMEVISTHVRATHARPLNSGKSSRKALEKIPCFILDFHHPPRGNEEPSLVFNSTSYPTGSQFVLEDLPGDRQVIRLTRLIDFSSAFARLGFELVASGEDSEGQSSKPYNEFDSLWNSL